MHKCCVWFTIIFLAAIIGVVAYFGFIQRQV